MARRRRADFIDAQLGTLSGKRLSEREGDVMRAILAGCTTRQSVADRLTISYGTASAHLVRIFVKAGAYNMADLVLMAVGRKPCDVDLSEFRR